MTFAGLPMMTFAGPGPLGWVARACLKSAVRMGHRVDVYSYGEVTKLPKGVSQKDASQVIPKEEIFTFDGIAQPEQTGSLAPFSDALRYRMLAEGRGIWMDWDLYFHKPLDLSGVTILGWEGPRYWGAALNPYAPMVGSALIGLMPSSPILKDLVELTSKPYAMPPWISPWLRFKVRRKLAGRPFHPGAIRYAEYGPIALFYYVNKHRMRAAVRPFTAHYPIDYRDVAQFLRPNEDFLQGLPPDTQTVHLWNSNFRRLTEGKLPKDSFAARLREESLDE